MIISEPIELKFGPDEETVRNKYVHDNIQALKRSLQNLSESKIIDWRKLKEGKPETPKKSFPWRGASNLVIQVVASNIETLLAQVQASIWEVSPLWSPLLVGEWGENEHGEEQRKAVEDFMSLMGHTKEELDLYRVESILWEAAIGYGFNAGKQPWVDESMSYCIGMIDGQPQFTEKEMMRGPRPEVIPFEDFAVNKNATTLEHSRFKFHKIHLTRHELEERKWLGRYNVTEDQWQNILANPSKPDRVELEGEMAKDLIPSQESIDQKWLLYECHYPYFVDFGGQKRRINVIETYHDETRTSMRAFFNWYPGNQNIFFGARLGYTDRGIYGLGFCEILKMAQEEVSAEHNRYADSGTLANTNLFRVDPDASTRIDANFSIYPAACMPFKKDEFEVMQLGRDGANLGIERERQMLELIKYRTGLDSGMSGAGGGIVNPKRGVYSAMGTFAALQAGNRKSNLRIADFRIVHQEIGAKALELYAEMGIGRKSKQFGKQGKYLDLALKNIKEGRIQIPVRASTASINLEMEKQNDMLMIGIMRQHYQIVGTLLEKMLQIKDQNLIDYGVKTIIGLDLFMRHILRNFRYDDLDRYLPEPQFIKQLKEQQDAKQGAGVSAGGASDGNSNPTGEAVSEIPIQPFNIQEQGSDTRSADGQAHESVSIPVH